MTTVGYGDYTPVTSPGRIIGFVVCVGGVILVSFTFIFVNKVLSFTPSELKSFTLLNSLL